MPGRINIVNIHKPSLEVHTVEAGIHTGAAGQYTFNVGGEEADFVPFFYNYAVDTIILRNRLRRDGYDSQTDEVYDALQAARLVRA